MKAITTKYLPATNTKGARVKAFDMDGNQTTLPWDSAISTDHNHESAAKALCIKMNWLGNLRSGWVADGVVWVFEKDETSR